MQIKHSSVPSQLVYWVKVDLHNLYNLKIGDLIKVAWQVNYLLEGDRYQWDSKGYEVCLNESGGDCGKCAKIFTKEITLAVPAASISGPPDRHNHIQQVLRWEEDERVG